MEKKVTRRGRWATLLNWKWLVWGVMKLKNQREREEHW